jgi:hypothetical protein
VGDDQVYEQRCECLHLRSSHVDGTCLDCDPRTRGCDHEFTPYAGAALEHLVCPSCGPLQLDEIGHPNLEELIQLDIQDPSVLQHRICVYCGWDLDDPDQEASLQVRGPSGAPTPSPPPVSRPGGGQRP